MCHTAEKTVFIIFCLATIIASQRFGFGSTDYVKSIYKYVCRSKDVKYGKYSIVERL